MARIGKKQLVILQKKYKTDQAVAKLYGMTRQGIHRLRRKYGIAAIDDKYSGRNTTIIDMHKQGFSVIKLAKKFGFSSTHVYRIIKSGNRAK